jgi:hypothetical protein
MKCCYKLGWRHKPVPNYVPEFVHVTGTMKVTGMICSCISFKCVSQTVSLTQTIKDNTKCYSSHILVPTFGQYFYITFLATIYSNIWLMNAPILCNDTKTPKRAISFNLAENFKHTNLLQQVLARLSASAQYTHKSNEDLINEQPCHHQQK